jgi:hypothetical protein
MDWAELAWIGECSVALTVIWLSMVVSWISLKERKSD